MTEQHQPNFLNPRKLNSFLLETHFVGSVGSVASGPMGERSGSQQNPHDPRQLDPRQLDHRSSFLLETNRTHEVGFPKVLLVQFPSVQWVSRRFNLQPTGQKVLWALVRAKLRPKVMLAPFCLMDCPGHVDG